jgi:type II secretory pathway pseudopilin PulG
LIEVLAALVLIGVVLPVAMRGISLSLLAASKARHTGEGVELARHKLAELSLATDVSAYVGTGDFGVEWPDYKWKSSYVSRDYGVNELTVEITWKSRGLDESLSLTTLTYPGAYLVGVPPAAATGGTTP